MQSTIQTVTNLNFNTDNIVFEVTETEKVQDMVHLKSVLDYYKQKGFKVDLDDIGSGYSSLHLLQALKPDYIKVDMETNRYIDKDKFKQSIYQALNYIAKANNIFVLAEGVETKAEYDFLKTEGIDFVQDYYFAKPQSKPQMINVL